MSELVAAERDYFYRRRSDGLIEKVSKEEDKIIAIQSSYDEIPLDRFMTHELDNGSTILVELNINADKALEHHQIAFSWALVDIICERVAEGESLVDICKDSKMPKFATFSNWRRRYPELRARLRQSKIDSAEIHFHKAIMEAEASTSKDDASSQKLKSEIHKWAAQALDNENYGNKTKVSGDKDSPVQIVFDTGIRRRGDYKKDEACYDEREVEPGVGEIDGGTVKADIDDIGSVDHGGGDSGEIIND